MTRYRKIGCTTLCSSIFKVLVDFCGVLGGEGGFPIKDNTVTYIQVSLIICINMNMYIYILYAYIYMLHNVHIAALSLSTSIIHIKLV